jgi:hypothetical protein
MAVAPETGRAFGGETAMAKLVHVVITTLSIVAGPALVALVDGRLPLTPYVSELPLRGSVGVVSEFQLRGSLR